MQTAELRPLSVGEVLDVAIKIYLRNARTLLVLVALVVTPVQLIVSLVYVSAIPDYDQSVFSETTPTSELDEDDVWIEISAFLVGVVLTFVAGTLATAACFKGVADAYLGESSEWRTSLSFALRRSHSILWVTILGTLLSLLGLVFLIVPGVWLWVAFAVAVPVLLTEGVKGRRALGRSRRLVKGRWWPTFGILLLGSILTGIVATVFAGLIEGVLLTDLGSETTAVVLLDAGATTVATVLTTPFTAAFIAVLYFDLRVRKEGFDLQLLAERIGVEVPPEWSRTPLPPSPLDAYPSSGEQPPFWPPPPGWKPSGGQAED